MVKKENLSFVTCTFKNGSISAPLLATLCCQMERVHESTPIPTSRTAAFVLFVAVLLAFVVETQTTQVSGAFMVIAIT